MILLTGHSLTPERKVPLEALSLDLKERDSTATMTPADMTGIGVNSWLLDEKNPGAGIVWRVKTIAQAYATDTPSVQLEHLINSLRDNIVFGEITAATITGNPKATTCTAEQAVRYILSYQRDWVLGSFGYGGVSNPYKFDGDSLFDALETVTNSLSGAWWSYDMSVYPFRLNITAKPDGVASEMRAGRNLKVITKTVDKSGMYTRFYPTGKDDLHIAGDYVERNANIYGVVSKIETDNSIDSEAELRRWATERLANHCEPTVTIDVEGLELADATGEPLDRLQLGRYCRIPLQEFGTTITERVVALNYPDKVHNPEAVRITLANNRTDVTKIIADAIKGGSGGRGGRTTGKQNKEDHAWIEDTEDHVALCAEALIGRDANGVDWYRLSSIIVDGDGIHQKVERTDGRVTTAYTLIDQNEQRIMLEAQARQAGDTTLQGKITVEADRITQEVSERKNGDVTLQGKITVQADRITNEVTRAVNEERSLKGMIDVQADRVGMTVGTTDSRPIRYIYQTQYLPRPGDPSVIYYCQDSGKYYEWKTSTNSYHLTTPGQYIKAGEICVAINDSGDTSATINADKIYQLGQVISNTITANYIATKIASIANLNVQSISSERGGLSMYNIATTNFSQGGVTCYLPNAIWTLQIVQDGNNYKLQRQRYNDEGWTDVGTFSRATTLTGAWDSGRFTVSASPQGNSKYTDLTTQGHWGYAQGEDPSHYYGGVSATIDGGQTSYSTGCWFEIDASAIYNPAAIAGWNDYEGQSWYIPTDEGSNGKFLIPSTKDANGNWSYVEWTRATTAWNDRPGGHNTPYNMSITNKTSIGGGVYAYTLTMNSDTNFSLGAITFYR